MASIRRMSATANQRPLPDYPDRSPATEHQTLTEFLDYYRGVLARKADGLTQEELARTAAASFLTLGGLIKHMALVEDAWLTERFAGGGLPEPWKSADFETDHDWEFHSAVDDPPAYLMGLFDQACARSRRVVADAESLDTEAARTRDDGVVWNLRWIMVHMIEEYARHCGHADLLRESIDGSTED